MLPPPPPATLKLPELPNSAAQRQQPRKGVKKPSEDIRKGGQGESKTSKRKGKQISSSLVDRIKALAWRGRYTLAERYPVTVGKKMFHLQQTVCGERKGLGTGSTVWDGGQILSKFIEFKYDQDEKFFNGKTVIELGSGTGIVGLVAGILGAKSVTLTDQKQILHLTKTNIEQCAREGNDDSILDRVSCAEYNWGDNATGMGAPFDLVLVADCIVPKLYPMEPLVDALLKVSGINTTILICYDHRINSEVDPRLKFRSLCEDAGFVFKIIPRREWHPDFRLDDCYIWELKIRMNDKDEI